MSISMDRFGARPHKKDDAVKPATDPFGLHAYVTKPVEQSTNGGAGQVVSGAVVVVWEPPPPPDQFPDQAKSPSKWVVVLGGSTVRVSGTPGNELAGAASASPGDFFAPPAPEAGSSRPWRPGTSRPCAARAEERRAP